jgi:hypothetical protein
MIKMAQIQTSSKKKRIESSTLVKQHLLGTSITLQMSANSVNMKVETVDSAHKGDKHSAGVMVWFLSLAGIPYY